MCRYVAFCYYNLVSCGGFCLQSVTRFLGVFSRFRQQTALTAYFTHKKKSHRKGGKLS